MVQSNPLCRLETADTTEERRIAALSNRCLSLLLYTILSFREKSKSMFWSKRKEVTRLSPFTGHTCCSLKFLQLSLSRPNLDPHQSSCPELKSDNFWTHFFPSRLQLAGGTRSRAEWKFCGDELNRWSGRCRRR